MLTLYSKSNCGKCDELKKILDFKGIIHEVVNLSDQQALLTFKAAYPHVKSVPFLAGTSLLFRDAD